MALPARANDCPGSRRCPAGASPARARPVPVDGADPAPAAQLGPLAVLAGRGRLGDAAGRGRFVAERQLRHQAAVVEVPERQLLVVVGEDREPMPLRAEPQAIAGAGHQLRARLDVAQHQELHGLVAEGRPFPAGDPQLHRLAEQVQAAAAAIGHIRGVQDLQRLQVLRPHHRQVLPVQLLQGVPLLGGERQGLLLDLDLVEHPHIGVGGDRQDRSRPRRS